MNEFKKEKIKELKASWRKSQELSYHDKKENSARHNKSSLRMLTQPEGD